MRRQARLPLRLLCRFSLRFGFGRAREVFAASGLELVQHIKNGFHLLLNFGCGFRGVDVDLPEHLLAAVRSGTTSSAVASGASTA